MSHNFHHFLLRFFVLIIILGSSLGQLYPQLSYFFGAKQPTNTLCAQQTIKAGTKSPTVVYGTGPNNIQFITVTADRYSKAGFVANVGGGFITLSKTLSVNVFGSPKLPYNINVQFWC